MTTLAKGRILLSREAFRDGVFARDGHRCVLCRAAAVDAHHILERRLWPDGGYYLDNGASVCAPCHLSCERTTVSVEQVREACGILSPMLPPHLYDDERFDKWGNSILANGQRVRGELFFDESVQKVLAEGGVLGDFTAWVKYPRTYHVPWTGGVGKDDRVLASLAAFEGQRVIVTEKMDGENTTWYRDHFHARSVDGRHHPSRDWVKGLWGRLRFELPEGWRVCGENLYAQHSIRYAALPTYFLGFSVWNERNVCLSWDETCEYLALLGITPVPVLYDGVFDEARIRALWSPDRWEAMEGYVMRVARELRYGEFRTAVGKFVRPKHVQTTKHWMAGQPIVPNQLASSR